MAKGRAKKNARQRKRHGQQHQQQQQRAASSAAPAPADSALPPEDRDWLPRYEREEAAGPAALALEHALGALSGLAQGACSSHRRGRGPCAAPLCFEGLWERPAGPAAAAGSALPAPAALREGGQAGGLVNLGSTCYLNALLQPLHAIAALRHALYASAASAQGPAGAEGARVVDELCRVMLALEGGRQAAVRPEGLVDALRLQRGRQQDAQEFLALLLSFLDERAGPAVRAAVRALFRGRSAYVTQCGTCGRASETAHDWLQLEASLADGCASLEDSLRLLTAPEPLVGPNRYSCEACRARVDAQRRVSLRALPPHLIFQCLRFVYDLKLQTKRKVSRPLSFPLRLDMRPYLDPAAAAAAAPSDCLYELTAAVIHKGASAHGGHYVAHVRDEAAGRPASAWLRFDDDAVATLPLAAVGEEPVPPAARLPPPDAPVERLSSCNSYMLFYRRLGPDPQPALVAPPERLQQALTEANEQLERDHREHAALVAERARRAAEVEHQGTVLLGELRRTQRADQGRWVAASWLRAWSRALQLGQPAPPLEAPLCPHGQLAPEDARRCKFISQSAFDHLLEVLASNHPAPPHSALPSPAPPAAASELCRVCGEEYVRQRVALARDARERQQLLADNAAAPEARRPCYVSKAALADWRKRWPYERAAADEAGRRLLDDIRCKHGQLLPERSKREAVTAELWFRLCSLYPRELDDSGGRLRPCERCEAEVDQRRKERASLRKSCGPLLQLAPPTGPADGARLAPGLYYAFPCAWLERLRTWLDGADAGPWPGLPDCAPLLCEHRQLRFAPFQANGAFVLAPADLHDALANIPAPGAPAEPVSLSVLVEPGGLAAFSPPPCTEGCVAAQQAEAERARFEFVDKLVHVSRYQPASASGSALAPASAAPASDGATGHSDLRRSQRKRRGGGGPTALALDVAASASDTVQQLKLRVFELAEIPPAAQVLRFGEQVLHDDSLPLFAYSVPAGAALTLEELEGDRADLLMLDAGPRHGAAEDAFEGSSLLGAAEQEEEEEEEEEEADSDGTDEDGASAAPVAAPAPMDLVAPATPSRPAPSPCRPPAPCSSSSSSPAPSGRRAKAGWSCPACTLDNEAKARTCAACSAPRS